MIVFVGKWWYDDDAEWGNLGNAKKEKMSCLFSLAYKVIMMIVMMMVTHPVKYTYMHMDINAVKVLWGSGRENVEYNKKKYAMRVGWVVWMLNGFGGNG